MFLALVRHSHPNPYSGWAQGYRRCYVIFAVYAMMCTENGKICGAYHHWEYSKLRVQPRWNRYTLRYTYFHTESVSQSRPGSSFEYLSPVPPVCHSLSKPSLATRCTIDELDIILPSRLDLSKITALFLLAPYISYQRDKYLYMFCT
jgi:hypothetical protein